MQAASLYNDFSSLAGLRLEARRDADATLEAVASQFEALFLQSMLKSMREAVPQGGLFDSQRMQGYREMHDQQLALDMAQQGGVGLAESLVEQLRAAGRVGGADSASGSAQAGEGLNMPQWGSIAAPRLVRPAEWAPAGQSDFVRDLLPHAERAAERLGVPAGWLVAQAALETGWGQHTLKRGEASSFNVFNIKANAHWRGPVAEVTALEYVEGAPVLQRSRFRAYPSLAEAFDDYAALIAGSGRYQDALSRAPDGAAYVRGLQAAGYATDPAYADKIIALARGAGLDGAHVALNRSADRPLTSS